MAYQYEVILIGTVGGLVRNLIGYLKARMKHHDSFHPGKFVAALVWGTIVGAAITFLGRGYALVFAPLEIVLIAMAGTMIIDELLQALFIRSKGAATALPAAAKAEKPAKAASIKPAKPLK